MQFTSLLISAFVAVALAQGNNPLCKPSEDCCYGGKDGGLAGCEAQIYAENCGQPAYRVAMCFNNGVKASECDADCCSIKDKVGRGCPK